MKDYRISTNNSGRTIIIITDKSFLEWFTTTHCSGEDLQFPSQYYSAPEEYINGIIYGITQSAGRKSINRNKNVIYFTIITKSKLLSNQLNELMFLYLNISAHTSSFVSKDRPLYISNIRMSDYVCDVFGIDVTDDEKKCIPPSSVYELEDYADLDTILSTNVKKLGKTHETYRFHLKNNNSIIGLNGLIYKSETGIHL